jgi:hypothetical protein
MINNMMIITKRILLRLFRALFTFFARRVPDLPFLPLPVVIGLPFLRELPGCPDCPSTLPLLRAWVLPFLLSMPTLLIAIFISLALSYTNSSLRSAVCISNISTSLDKIMILEFIISYFHLASLTNCIYNSCTYQKVVTP